MYSKQRLISFIFSILLMSVVGTFPAAAQFVCSSEVEYGWVKVTESGELGSEEYKVFWSAKDAEAETEALAKKRLEEMMQQEKVLAREACKKEHENLSGCMASKFQAMKAVMKQLGFSSRKALEDSVSMDCKAQVGVCKSVSMKEVACHNLEPEMEEGEEGAEGKKSKKKK